MKYLFFLFICLFSVPLMAQIDITYNDETFTLTTQDSVVLGVYSKNNHAFVFDSDQNVALYEINSKALITPYMGASFWSLKGTVYATTRQFAIQSIKKITQR